MGNLVRGYPNADGDIVFVLAPERYIRLRAGGDLSLDDGLLIDRKYYLFRTALFIGPLGRFNRECIPRNRGDASRHGLELRRLCGDGSFLRVDKRSMIRGDRRGSRSAARTHGHRGEQSAQRIHKDLRTTPHFFDAPGVAADGLYGRGESCTTVQAKTRQILPPHHSFYQDRQYSTTGNEVLSCVWQSGTDSNVGGYASEGRQSARGIQGARLPRGSSVSGARGGTKSASASAPISKRRCRIRPAAKRPDLERNARSRVSRTYVSSKCSTPA